MGHVIFRAEGYSGSFASMNRSGTHSVGRADVARALISLRLQRAGVLAAIREFGFNWAVLSRLEDSLFALQHCVNERGNLGINSRFRQLSPTDKRNVSRRIGEAFCKIYAERLLSIPRLMVLESLRAAGAASVTYISSAGNHKQPDLIGQDSNNDWHVLEAKGRSRADSLGSALLEGKNQAANVARIDGAEPSTRTVCFTQLDRPFRSVLRDPEASGVAQVQINHRNLDGMYYGFALSRPSSRPRVFLDGEEFEFADTGDLNVRVGVASRILNALRESPTDLNEQIRNLKRFEEREEDQYSIGSDGIIVSLVGSKYE